MWIEFELKDGAGIVWKAAFDTNEIHHFQLSRDKCAVQVGGIGELKFADAELGLRCYQAFICAMQGHMVGIDEIGYIKPLKTPEEVHFENELNKKIEYQFEKLSALLAFEPAEEAKKFLSGFSYKEYLKRSNCCPVHSKDEVDV
jgi:hypothetical protein